MSTADAEALLACLGESRPFAALSESARAAVAASARTGRYGDGEVVLDAFTRADDAVYLVLAGRVAVWLDADQVSSKRPQEMLERGGVFGFSAMLTGRSIGPRAVAAADDTVVARLPAESAQPAFTSPAGAEFLAEHVLRREAGAAHAAAFTLVDDLVVRQPLVVAPATTLRAAAATMTERDMGYAAVAVPGRAGEAGLVTDRMLRRALGEGADPDAVAVRDVLDPDPPRVLSGSSAADALLLLLDREADYVLVTERDGRVRGAVDPRDFMASDLTVGVSLHERLRRAEDVAELQRRAAEAPRVLAGLLARGMASARVITVYSAIVDTLVRRAIGLVFAEHPELSVDAFTWLSLGSNGRREAVPSSDLDAAVAFDDAVSAGEMDRYCALFAQIERVLAGAGLSTDPHGAFPSRRAFARTNAQWRAAAGHWLAAPERDQGAIMTSLLVDGRPIHGDPGLPEVNRIFADLRAHPATMRLLLQESLAKRARPVRGTLRGLSRRSDAFDVKEHALLPIVNLARWGALSAGSTVLPTTERLDAASGTAILPDEQAQILSEVFVVLQRLRLHYQLRQLDRGGQPSDRIKLTRLSAVDRSIVTRAVREIAAVQRRMDNVSAHADPESWTVPEPT